MNTFSSNMFGSFNQPFGGKKPDSVNGDNNKTFDNWNSNIPYSQTNPFSPLNFNNFTDPKISSSFQQYNTLSEYTTGYNNGYTSGHCSGYNSGYSAGYLKAISEYNKSFNPPYTSPISSMSYNYIDAYSNGYDCGIKNYINAINLINAYNPSIHSTSNSQQDISPNKSYTSFNKKVSSPIKKTQNNKWKKKNENSKNKTPKDYTPTDLDISPTTGETKPLLIIRKISKEINPSENNNISSILSSLFGEEEKKESINYLEDSDDEIDNLVTVNDIKCTEEIIKNQKEKFDDVKIVLLKEIIEKDNINSIDDLITIGNYYEKNFLDKKMAKDKEDKEEDKQEDKEDELSIMESIIKSIGIPLTPTTKIIINNKTKKTVLSSPNKSISEKNDSPTNDILELYKLENYYFTINLEKVYKMKGHLIKLKKMIGLDNIKNEIIDMILYYLMEFEKKNNNMLHMTLEGSPGCGKTKLAKIISKLLGVMGILDNDKVVYARRTDMIGQYLGQTGQKTQQVINSALGGVLFIDEAYSLGNSKKDIYSKECLDILNQNLSDNKKKLVCIIAGYPEELENYFFSSNPGLTRRFPFRFKINNYTYSELLDIFVNKINKLDWKINKSVNLNEFFEKNISHFKYFGGDIDTFIQDIKYSHSRRVVCAHPSEFRIIIKDDINKAFEKFKNRRKIQDNESWKGMFV